MKLFCVEAILNGSVGLGIKKKQKNILFLVQAD